MLIETLLDIYDERYENEETVRHYWDHDFVLDGIHYRIPQRTVFNDDTNYQDSPMIELVVDHRIGEPGNDGFIIDKPSYPQVNWKGSWTYSANCTLNEEAWLSDDSILCTTHLGGCTNLS